MGFVSTTCNVCEQAVGLNCFKIKAGWICPECLKALSKFVKISNERIIMG